MSSMTLQLGLTLLIWYLGCWKEAESYPSRECENGIALTKVPDYQKDVGDIEWNDQNEEQVQNVFKRFLFHYAKAHKSEGTVQHESHSVHPLLRLSPKLSQRNKKQLLLLIRTLPEGVLRNREAWRSSRSQLHLRA
ncbi:neuromedin-U isoform X2 [Hypomesus transpacificus]|uniref:neuromedin-U isoform X2 n=1 Tax=Hypomesus transpacificus TaxID=137520 RepID=UPI001F07A2A9|nr:neuromedin-U isoform X2 [Hypomesus transpacificus]